MMYFHRRGWQLLTLALVLTVTACAAPNATLTGTDILITEFMAKDNYVLRDDDGQFVDWIELYNPTNQPVDLTGWHLTDDNTRPHKWTFPATLLNAGDYLIVYASGKDRATPGAALHTNFLLSSEGEYLGLYKPFAEAATFDYAPAYPIQISNVSYGITATDVDADYFFSPTPNLDNNLSISFDQPSEITFSHERGLYTDAFALALAADVENAEIRYTLDGSTPEPGISRLYTEPLQIDSTTVVRAVAHLEGIPIASKSATHTYIFVDQVRNQQGTPAGYPNRWTAFQYRAGYSFFGFPADYDTDPEIVDHVEYGPQFETALQELPTMALSMTPDDMFGRDGLYNHPLRGGLDWERVGAIEMFGWEDEPGFQVDAGVRIHGASSRKPNKSPKRSFRLKFRKEYGSATLNYPIFPDSDAIDYDNLVLRAGYNMSWVQNDQYFTERIHAQYLRDQWMRDSIKEMGHLYVHGRFVHLYINGYYWGVYSIVERPDASFASRYLGGVPEDYISVNSGRAVDGLMVDELAGDDHSLAWEQFFEIVDAELKPETPLSWIEQYIDLDNFIDFMILNHFAANHDWDHMNWYAIRPADESDVFTMIVWDGEQTLRQVDDDRLWTYGDHRPTQIFHVLRENEDFQKRFDERVELHLTNGGALTPERNIERYYFLADQLETAIIAESARWGDYRRDVHPVGEGPFLLYTQAEWLAEQRRLVEDYFPYRTDEVLLQYHNFLLYTP